MADQEKLLDVADADRIMAGSLLALDAARLPIGACTGRVLREDIYADGDFPPFDRVMMDGIAIRHRDWEAGHRCFPVRGLQAAGIPRMELPPGPGCLEVMTGAVLPAGCDTVLPYEQLRLDEEAGIAESGPVAVRPYQHVHRRGTDRVRGELLVPAGTRLAPPEIGIAASVGRAELLVSGLPSVVVVSTGDELVDVGVVPAPHQIRRSNVYALVAALGKAGITAETVHLPDRFDVLRSELAGLLQEFQVIILSGGVSKGRFDFVPRVLDDLGITCLFHRLRQKPGKPFWYGRGSGDRVVFAFPGNPVSTFMCFYRYFLPWLRRSEGEHPQTAEHAILGAEVVLSGELTYFLQVKLSQGTDGALVAQPVAGGGSGDHANLLRADGFLELPAGRSVFAPGDPYPLIRFR
jgi:molybdopterin molybdotransferase